MSGFSSSRRVRGHAALLAARQVGDRGVARRAAQRVHRDLQLVVERPAVDRVDLLLKLAHLGHQGVEIGVLGRVGHQRADRVEAVHHVGDRADAVHDVFLDRAPRVELRLLLQIADGDVLARPCLAREILVDPCHDLDQGRLAGAVGADDADLRALIELQVDVAQHRLGGAGEGLGHVLHHEGVLGGHVRVSVRLFGCSGIWRRCSDAPADWQTCRSSKRRASGLRRARPFRYVPPQQSFSGGRECA